jgi:hypothetical protein
VSNPELHTIDEVLEKVTLTSRQLNRSLTDMIVSEHEPTFAGTAKTKTNYNEHVPSDDDDDMTEFTQALQSYLSDDDNVNQPSKSKLSCEPTSNNNQWHLLTSIDQGDDEDDDDDIWCNSDDEENLQERVKLDQEKEKNLREILGNDTLDIVYEALRVRIHVKHRCFRVVLMSFDDFFLLDKRW